MRASCHLCVVATTTFRCSFGVDDTLAVVLRLITMLLDAERLCTEDVSLALLLHQNTQAAENRE